MGFFLGNVATSSTCNPGFTGLRRKLEAPLKLVNARAPGAHASILLPSVAVADFPKLPFGSWLSMPKASLAMSVKPMPSVSSSRYSSGRRRRGVRSVS